MTPSEWVSSFLTEEEREQSKKRKGMQNMKE